MYPMYIKMDAPDQLLLSEGVCRQLGIIEYHEDVEKWRGGWKKVVKSGVQETKEAKVPVVQVKLVQSLRLSPHQSSIVQVHVEDCGGGSPVYMECDPHLEDETGLCVEDAPLQLDASGCAQMIVSNPSSYTTWHHHWPGDDSCSSGGRRTFRSQRQHIDLGRVG